MGKYFFFTIMVGLVTYFVAICVVGPRNKFTTPKTVIKMMTTCREQFRFVDGPVDGKDYLDENMPCMKGQSRRATFKSLPRDSDGISQFKVGLASYGKEFLAIWAYADAQNSWNVCEMKHGMPFFRLAKFGFMAAPSPSDLAGILNANACYTFSTGLLQLGFGGYMASLDWPPQLEIILPLSVSLSSFILSALNLVLNFSAILYEISYEQRLVDEIEASSQVELESDKRHEREARDARLQKAKKDWEAEADKSTGRQMAFDDLKRKIESDYDIEVGKLNEANSNRLVMELTNYRIRMADIKQAKRGKLNKPLKQDDTTASERYSGLKKDWLDKIKVRKEVFDDKMNGLDAKSEDYITKLREIKDQWKEEEKNLNDMMQEELLRVR